MRTNQWSGDRSNATVTEFSSRFQPPRLLHEQLNRPHLIEQLLKVPGSVNLLLGPPGGGRSVLMSECYRHLQESGETVCWLNLAYTDNDPATLRRHIIQAFGINLDDQDMLLNMPSGVSGFIDGAHWLDCPAALEVLQAFVLSVPRNSRLVVSASQIKAQSLRSAELSGIIRVFGARQLRMSDEEARVLLAGHYSAEQVRHINAFVQGWPAGLRFLQRAPEFCRQLLADPMSPPALPQEMADYLETHLCQNTEATRLQALMELSVLQRFVPEQIAAMPQASCDWALVDEYLRDGWLLHYVDDQQHWAAVQPALACYLSTRLSRYNPERYKQLRYFAANWLGEHGYPLEALQHAITLDSTPLTARLAEEAGAVSRDLGAGPSIELPELLPVEKAAEYPLVFIGQLYQRIRVGRLREARLLFDQAWQRTDGFTRVAGSQEQQVKSWAELYRTVFITISDTPLDEGIIAHIASEVERLLVLEPVLACGWGSLLAYGKLDQRLFSEAISAADTCLDLGAADGRARICLFLQIHKAHALLALGRTQAATQCAQIALNDAIDYAGMGSYEAVSAGLTRGWIYHLCGDDERALSLLLPALECVRHTSGWAPLYAEAYTAAAKAIARRDGFNAAEALLMQADVFAQERGLARLTALLAVARIHIRIAAGHWREALLLQQSDVFESLLYSQPASPYELSIHVPAVLTSAHLMLELNRPADALNYLSRLDGFMIDHECCRWRITYHLLTALACFATRRYSLALEHSIITYEQASRSGLRSTLGPTFDGLQPIYQWAFDRDRALPEGMAQ